MLDAKNTDPVEVASGVWWARIPMAGGLDHINVWLLEDGDSWTIVDTGLNLDQSREAWQEIFDNFLGDRPISRVISTHMHPDHLGLAGWLLERDGGKLWMSREEFFMCRDMVSYTGKQAPEGALEFYRSAGFTDEQLEGYKSRFGAFGRAIYTLPQSYIRIQDGDTLTINDQYWQVVVGRGHSPEHVCLYSPSLKLLISGDQVLPKITSNVSVHAVESQGNPMREWLRSCRMIRATIPRGVLVLPAHETPFYGLHERLNQLIEEHENDLAKVYNALEKPHRAVDLFPYLFKREIDEVFSLTLATGETIANLNCLLGQEKVVKSRDSDGVYWYQQKQRAG